MPRTMAIGVIDRLFVVVYGEADPTDPEWADYLALVEHHGIDRTAQLIVTDGGAPSARQRDALNRLLDGRSVPTAVVSGARRVRWRVGVLSWFNRELRAFSPSSAGLEHALAYLEVGPTRGAKVQQELRRLRLELRTPTHRRGVA